MIFYFSGTGNSAWVARQIAKAQQEELLAIAEEINKNKEYALKDGEKVGFVFPVYAWGPPGIVLRFIRQLKMKNPEYLFFVFYIYYVLLFGLSMFIGICCMVI